MKRHLNLMSESAVLRESVRSHVRLWLRIWAVSFALLITLGLVCALPAYNASYARAQLEAEYEPIRMMKAENKSLKQKILNLNGQENHILTLTDQFPTVSLLGLVGQAVDATEKNIFLKEIDFTLREPQAQPEDHWHSSLVLEGFSVKRSAITSLTESLQSKMPNADIQLQSATDVRVNQQPMLAFTIQCTF